MMNKVRGVFGLLRDTVTEWWEDEAPRAAAALSFYTLLSLAPLVLIVVALVGVFLGRGEAQSTIQDQVSGLVGSRGADVIAQVIKGADRPSTGLLSSVLGFAILLFGASGVFGEPQNALNRMWDVRPKPGQGIRE